MGRGRSSTGYWAYMVQNGVHVPMNSSSSSSSSSMSNHPPLSNYPGSGGQSHLVNLNPGLFKLRDRASASARGTFVASHVKFAMGPLLSTGISIPFSAVEYFFSKWWIRRTAQDSENGFDWGEVVEGCSTKLPVTFT
eukprot:2665606-Rhodomonas_salina.1